MSTPSAQLGLPIIALSDSPDVPRDHNALISVLESRIAYFSTRQVRDVGEVAQVRAGRYFTAADFTSMGLTAPLGIWNLADLTDVSGNGRTLTNKGAIPFTTGILGAASTAALFAGSTAQALYIVNATWQQIQTGSWGCWFRTAKRGVQQIMIGRGGTAAPNFAYYITVNTSNVVSGQISYDGTNQNIAAGVTDVADDRWHFGVVTSDGTRLRTYVDGVLEGSVAQNSLIFPASGPLNIGAFGADASTAATSPHYGRVAAAFISPDVLTDDQVRLLYASAFTHALAAAPTSVRVQARRRRRGGPILTTDFPSTPLRLYNFTGGAVTDAGSNAQNIAALGGGSSQPSAGADGLTVTGWAMSGSHTGVGSTDAGLPSGTASRSYGAWFKTSSFAAQQGIIGWGTIGTADVRIAVLSTSGSIAAVNAADVATGPFVSDGFWHHAVVVEDNAPADGVKRKLYLDGRLVAASLVLNSLTLAGASRFRIGAAPDGTLPMTGSADGAFVIGVALTSEQVRTLYNLGSQALPASPKSEGDHVETLEATRLLAIFDTLEGCDQVDLQVLS